jgi:hypothetical protein
VYTGVQDLNPLGSITFGLSGSVRLLLIWIRPIFQNVMLTNWKLEVLGTYIFPFGNSITVLAFIRNFISIVVVWCVKKIVLVNNRWKMGTIRIRKVRYGSGTLV